MNAAALRLGLVAVVGLTSAASCGPGPLPPESPAETLASTPEPVPVQVESSAEESSAPVIEPALTEAPTPTEQAAIVASAERGFLVPESILYDAVNDKYFVSNINGNPTDVDNNGFISIVDPDGSVAQLDFIAGGKNGVTLNAPKGLALHDGTLYVADITAVRKFDAKTGAPRGAIQFPKATFINDVVADTDGTLYVSDTAIKIAGGDVTATGTDAIYKLQKGKVTVFAQGAHLNRPNGIALLNGSVVAATFGNKQLFLFDAKGNITSTTELPGSTLDGVVVLPDGQLLVSSWEKQAVYIGSLGGVWTIAADGLPSPADIGFDSARNRVLVPVFQGNELRFVTLAMLTTPGSAGAEGGAPAAPAASTPAAPPNPSSTTATSPAASSPAAAAP